MNVKLYKECVKLHLGHNEKHVLRSLASFAARGSGEAYPSVETIANDTSLGTTIVRRCLRTLEVAQVITSQPTTRGGGRGCTTHYFITPENHKLNARVLPLYRVYRILKPYLAWFYGDDIRLVWDAPDYRFKPKAVSTKH